MDSHPEKFPLAIVPHHYWSLDYDVYSSPNGDVVLMDGRNGEKFARVSYCRDEGKWRVDLFLSGVKETRSFEKPENANSHICLALIQAGRID